MDRVLVLLEHKENRRLLAEWLKDRYELVLGAGEESLEGDFDLGILDGPMLERLEAAILARRELEEPALLPFLLITSRPDVRYVTQHLWRTVDELILTPIEKVELWARVEILLRARRLSLELYGRYLRLFENVPVGLFRSTLDGKVVDVNSAIVDILGCPNRDWLIGKDFTKLCIRPEDCSHLWTILERDRAVHDFLVQLRRVDGKTIWASISVQPVYDRQGRLTYYEGVLQDVTEKVHSEQALRESHDRLEELFAQTVDVLGAVVELRDPYTAGHQRRVAEISCELAEALGLSEERIVGLRIAALLHDVGKIVVPAEILNKPGPLSMTEMALVKAHPQAGHDILKKINFPWPVAEIVLQHHERLDGSGYPRGLKGDAIMLESRILAVADVVEAMASHRPYRPARSFDEVLTEITKNQGRLYDSQVVEAFLSLQEKFKRALANQ